MTRRRVAVAAVALALAAGCRDRVPFTEPLALAGGKSVSAEVLNDGYEAYTLYCYACHGEKGDGRGPSAPGMRPPPRDFTTAMFKFAGVSAGELPNDDDLAAVIANGLDGTPMLPWDITEGERSAIVQYLKTFSDRWKTDAPGQRVLPEGPDPWVGKEAEAIEIGLRMYHLLGAEMDPATGTPRRILVGCNACHPSYLTRQEIDRHSQAALGAPAALRDDAYHPALKESEYRVGDLKLSVLPTDFLFHRIKNGTTPEALYRTIAAGIGGTAMPFWKASIKDADLWALSRYVKSLADMRGTPDAIALQARIASGK